MGLRTRRSLPLLASLMLVVAACGGTPATAPPATGTPTAQPPTATPGEPTPTPGPGETTAPPATATPVAPTQTPDTTPTEGGIIIIGEWQRPSTVHPFLSSAWVTQQAIMPVLPPKIIVDDQGAWVPYLLTELPTIAEAGDGFTVTMTMKPGLTWSDGEALDANDIAYTYDWAVEMVEAGIGCGGCGSIALRLPDDSDYYITGHEVSADNQSITFNWQDRYAGWLAWSSYSLLPEQYFGTIAPADVLASMPIGPGLTQIPGYGPFIVSDAAENRIDYVRNDRYGAFDRPYLDGLRRLYYPGSKDGMIAAFLTGEIDQMQNLTQIDYQAVQQQLDQQAQPVGRAELLGGAWLYEHLDLNSSGPNSEAHGLDDPRVRNAIHLAIDKADLWNRLFPGAGDYVDACTNAPPTSWWAQPTVTCAPYDPAAASALLDEAGWTGTPRTHNGGTPDDPSDDRVMRLKMCTTVGNPTRLQTLGTIAGYLSAVGIPAEVVTQQAAILFADYPDVTDDTECALSRGNYQLGLFTYLLSDPGALLYSLFHSGNIPPGGDNGNWTRINDPDLDALLEEQVRALTQEEILGSLTAVYEKVTELKPEIPLYYRAEVAGVSNHLGNFKINPSLYGPVWNVQEWYFIP